MSLVWDEIGKITPDLKSPHDLISELFEPIMQYTDNRVGYKLQKVNYFPEEVSVSVIQTIKIPEFVSAFDQMKSTVDHPEYGYDPGKTINNEEIRYRLLLYPYNKENYEFEIFKFKFPVLFYPVIVYISKDDIPELKVFGEKEYIIAEEENILVEIVNTIIKSKSTIRLLRRIMVI